MANIKIPVLLGEKSVKGTQLATGIIRVRDLIENYAIDTYDRLRGEMGTVEGGYQREASKVRVNKIAQSLLSNKIDIPTAIIVNIRESGNLSYLKKEGNRYLLTLDPSNPNHRLYIIDGQHRTRGLQEVLSDPETASAWEDKLVFATFYLGGEFDEEKESFYIVNTTAKSINTGSKLELRLGIDDVREEEKNAVLLTRKIADESKIWKNLIKYPNSKIGFLPNSAFITSLKHLYQQDWFQPMSLNDQYKLLDAFWNGLKIILPACFEEPEAYTLQRAVGTTVMHNIMGGPYMKLITQGRDFHNPNDWAEFLSPLREHSDRDRTPEENIVSGSEFWLSGSSGAAGRYSSGAGRSNLIALFRGKLS